MGAVAEMKNTIKVIRKKEDYRELFEDKKDDNTEILNVRSVERGNL